MADLYSEFTGTDKHLEKSICLSCSQVADLDMFDESQDWPHADVIAVGMVLHDCEYQC